MFSRLPGPVVGVVAYFCYALNTFLIGILIVFPLILMKLLMPTEKLRNQLTKWLESASHLWIRINALHGRFTRDLKWEIQGDTDSLSKQEWYLVLCNHQSWVDVVLVAEFLNARTATAKCFLKREALWIPVIGVFCWALDFPIMRRYSKSYLKQHPEKKGKDVEEVRAACEKYRNKPVTIINFIEGTRFTSRKHNAQQSPYRHLLKPKAGGVGLVMSSMGSLIHKIVHVTFVYPTGKKTFWDFLSNRTKRVVMRVETEPVTPDLIGNYTEDAHYRSHIQTYLNRVWEKKDAFMESVLTS